MSALPSATIEFPIPRIAVAELCYSECGDDGPALVAYLCPAKVWTLAWGRTTNVHPGDTCTPEQADQWLLEELTYYTKRVQSLCTAPTTPNELGAMVVFAYNIGLEGFAKSTVLRCHNAGNKQAASRAFGLWNMITKDGVKVVCDGLTARRARDSALYLRPEPGQRIEAMPQAIEAETPMRASPITLAGVASVTTGATAVIAQVSEPIKAARTTVVDVLHIPEDWFLPLVLVLAGAVVWYWRTQQRRQGWA